MTIALSYKPKCGIAPKTNHYPSSYTHNHGHSYNYYPAPKHCPTPCYDGHHSGYSYDHPVYHGAYVKAPTACKLVPADKKTPCDKPCKRKCVRHHYHTHEYGYGPCTYYPSFWFGGHGHYYDKSAHHRHGHHGYTDSYSHGHHDYHTGHSHQGYLDSHHHGHHGLIQSYGYGWPYYEY